MNTSTHYELSLHDHKIIKCHRWLGAQVVGSANLNRVTEVLIKRLQKKGMAPTAIPGFLRSVMIITVSDNPPMSLQEINRRLHVLGWDSFEMDDHTLQLITASLEAEGLMGAKNKITEWLKKSSERIRKGTESGV